MKTIGYIHSGTHCLRITQTNTTFRYIVSLEKRYVCKIPLYFYTFLNILIQFLRIGFLVKHSAYCATFFVFFVSTRNSRRSSSLVVLSFTYTHKRKTFKHNTLVLYRITCTSLKTNTRTRLRLRYMTLSFPIL